MALSMATDLGMGQPLETALRSCVVAVRLGEAMGLDARALRDAYYYALLRYIGCNVHTDAMAALFGDELALRRDIAAVDTCGRSRRCWNCPLATFARRTRTLHPSVSRPSSPVR